MSAELAEVVRACIDDAGDNAMYLEAAWAAARWRAGDLGPLDAMPASGHTAAALWAVSDGLERTDANVARVAAIVETWELPSPRDVAALGLWAGMSGEDVGLRQFVYAEQGAIVRDCLAWGHPADLDAALAMVRDEVEADFAQDMALLGLIRAREVLDLRRATDIVAEMVTGNARLGALVELAVRTPPERSVGERWWDMAVQAEAAVETDEQGARGGPAAQLAVIGAAVGRFQDGDKALARAQRWLDSFDDPIEMLYVARQVLLARILTDVERWRLAAVSLGADERWSGRLERDEALFSAVDVVGHVRDDASRRTAWSAAAGLAETVRTPTRSVATLARLVELTLDVPGADAEPCWPRLERQLAEAASAADARDVLPKAARRLAAVDAARTGELAGALDDAFLRGLWLVAVARVRPSA